MLLHLQRKLFLSPFADVFQGLCCLPGEYYILLDKDVNLMVHPPHREPVSERDAVKSELERLVNDQIIVPVTEPTD